MPWQVGTLLPQEHPLRHLGRCLTQNTEFLQVVQVDFCREVSGFEQWVWLGFSSMGYLGPKDWHTHTYVYICMFMHTYNIYIYYVYIYIDIYYHIIFMQHLKHEDQVGRQKTSGSRFSMGLASQQLAGGFLCLFVSAKVFVFESWSTSFGIGFFGAKHKQKNMSPTMVVL